MRRGDVVMVAPSGAYGKPRPSVIVQSDHLLEEHHSVIVALCTTHYRDADLFRVTIERDEANGLEEDSQIMVDKLVTMPCEKIIDTLGSVSHDVMRRMDRSLAFVLGLGDRISN